ncbi:thioesterase-like superfamily-domain-containing protein [Chytriomyces cf. hyalinus JEL632]|nr:thioesterase-like superfamily-domain-containing protein [Chytriomyces cf. hyalinus JEL632]
MQRQYLYHRLSKDTFRPTKLTIGPWSADSQHGGPPSALMASLLRAHAGDAFRLARLSVSLYRPVPTVGVHRLTITSLNETRSTKHLSITYADAHSNKLFARAEAILLIKEDATSTPAAIHAHLVQIEATSRGADVVNKVVPEFPDGAKLRGGVTVLAAEGKLSKFMHVMQAVFSVGRAWFGAADERLLDANRESPCVWYVRSSAGVGLWVDEMVEGGNGVGTESTSRDLDLLESAIMFGDASSGASGVLKWGEFMYSNIDYTVNFLRDPEPLTLNASTKDTDHEWVCFRSRTRINPAGSGVTVSDVYDRSGPFATTTQNLVVRKMESKL